MKVFTILPALVTSGAILLSLEARAVTGPLLAGTAKVSITPETDEPLHDPVYTRALVLDVGGI